MNTKLHTFALLGGMLLGGCISSEDPIDIETIDELDEPASPTASPTASPASEVAAQPEESVPTSGAVIPWECIGAPVVAILDNAEENCTGRSLPPNWIWNPMFDTGSPQVAAITLPVPEEFQKFCMFEYVGNGELKNPEDYAPILQFIDSHPALSLDTTAADCMGFKEQSGPTTLADPDLAKLLAESFMMNIDAPDAGELEDTLGYQRPVRLEVLDSVSQDAVDNGLTPHNEHGKYMSAIMRGIACPNAQPDCVDSIHHLLAMPRRDYQLPDWTVGEAYASKVDVAIQIFAAVQQWRQDKLNHEPHATDRLVLNISLGYQRVNAGVDDFSRGPQASLKAALDFASCHGAMVFAAAGNVRDENCPENESGPLAPAEFELLPAPTEAECHALGFIPDWEHDFPIFSSDRPLVYAVGGVDAYDERLPNSRKDSQPELVALGANAVGPGLETPLTGTSVSATVASATAKLLWSYQPRLRPDEVYAIMHKSGWDLGVPAEFGYWPGMNTHRLSVCASLQELCDGADPHECPQLGCYAAPPASDGNLGGFFQGVHDVLANPNTNIKEYDGHIGAPTCDVWSPTELVTPQPEQPVCGYCGADINFGSDNDQLYMSIAPMYQGLITDAILLVKDGAGTTHAVTFDPEVITSLNDSSIGVVKVTFDAPVVTKGATLSFSTVMMNQSNPVVLNFP
jgi:hypothetical protein